MRCPTCGTENTPDSRFCGGCGAKQFPSEPPTSRVAPTAKIPDDAPFPQSIPPNSYVAPNYQSSPPSMPPRAASPAMIPTSGPQLQPSTPASIPPSSLYGRAPTPVGPSNSGHPLAPSMSRANTAQPERSLPPARMAEPSMSMPAMPKPRVGLIIAVLVLDLGLAAAGAVMLGKGLSKSDPPPPPKTEGSAHADVTPAGSAVVAAPQPVASGLPANLPIAQLAGSADAGSAAPPPDKKAKKPTPKKDAPIDPDHALAAEIDLQAQRSKPELDRCYDDAGGAGAIHGQIEIAFRVQPDGRITNLQAVTNETGSLQLANCLTGIMTHWSFATHPAKTSDFMRPFTYP
jgi:hypothetical protein